MLISGYLMLFTNNDLDLRLNILYYCYCDLSKMGIQGLGCQHVAGDQQTSMMVDVVKVNYISPLVLDPVLSSLVC